MANGHSQIYVKSHRFSAVFFLFSACFMILLLFRLVIMWGIFSTSQWYRINHKTFPVFLIFFYLQHLTTCTFCSLTHKILKTSAFIIFYKSLEFSITQVSKIETIKPCASSVYTQGEQKNQNKSHCLYEFSFFFLKHIMSTILKTVFTRMFRQ